MDTFTFLIGICLVATGAVFIGFPIGRVYERRQRSTHWIRDHRVPRIIRSAQARLDEKDVLNAEVITENESWDEFISQFPHAK